MMLVENRMKRDPITISPETGILEASRLLRQHKIRHLPVVRGGRLVGILTDRDLKRVSPSPATSLSVYEVNYLLDKLEAKEVMIKQVVTVTPRTTIEDAARLLLTHKIGSLPVVDGEVLVGIITETDVLEALVEAMGIRGSCSRVEIVVEDTPAALYAIGDIVRERAGDIASIMTARATYRGEERKVLIVRIETDDPEETVKAIEKAGYPVLSTAV
jgi:acetoin utilization protein AcuB